uniref:berberine bridge enzyme-like 27 n=1 Tax=Erigeron canadensis TaxID=72917 RepID=UPI001CB9B755|nr:berberine bridge enzyme-like 27 [Erigeron canadensis]
MKFFTSKFVLSFILTLSISFFIPTSTTSDFFDCISQSISTNSSNIVFTPNESLYTTILQSTIQNLRFNSTTTPKPLAIITPLTYSHVQATIICSVEFGHQIRIRSGGHDYEGLSYTSFDQTTFILLDVNQFRSVKVDLEAKTAWVESGATLGELSYWVSKESNNSLGFPTGECTSVGVGGQLSGGGFGTMARKYGLSSDNVIDALLVDVNGRIMDRDTMGEDLFWAIRGGGGGSFGVVLSWKINLVYVPPIVTVFSLPKKLDKFATQLVNKWQYIGNNITNDLFMNLLISPLQQNGTMLVTINGLFLGRANELIAIMDDEFPELGLQVDNCTEMSYIESVVYYSVYLRGQSVETLVERRPWPKNYYKFKSDYVERPIPEESLEELWKWCLEENLILAMEPQGGKMSEIDETAIPYPHRKGNLYIIQYIMRWDDEGFNTTENHVASIRRVYEKMTPFVSKNPRGAYVNFRDLDLGTDGDTCSTSYVKAMEWGNKYFKSNFKRLAMVKGEIDPTNFFCNEQSIPPLVLSQSF